MCDLIEDYAKDYAARVSKQAARQAAAEATRKANAVARQATSASAVSLFKSGVDYSLVRSSITGISDKELTKLYVQATGRKPTVAGSH